MNCRKENDMKFRDYTITLRDSTGKIYELFINGECINEQIRTGASETEAVEGVEGNAFHNAIYRGDIGADAWAESINR
jgi:hypothetical protein